MTYQEIAAAAQAAIKYALPILEQAVADIQAGVPTLEADIKANVDAAQKTFADGKGILEKIVSDAKAKISQ